MMGLAPRGGPGGPGKRGGPGKNMAQNDPEHMKRIQQIQQLRHQSMMLGDKYSDAANADEKKKIEAELRKALGELYELRLTEMRYRVKKVEERLGKVKEELVKYEKDRNGVIDSWFKQLTAPDDYKSF